MNEADHDNEKKVRLDDEEKGVRFFGEEKGVRVIRSWKKIEDFLFVEHVLASCWQV